MTYDRDARLSKRDVQCLGLKSMVFILHLLSHAKKLRGSGAVLPPPGMIFKSISSVAHLHLSRLLPRRPIQVRPIRAVGSDGSEDLAAALCPKYVVSVEYEVKALVIFGD